VITFIVPTIGRPSLADTLASIETYPGDEILLVGDRITVNDPRVTYLQCPRGNDWGAFERNFATPHARGQYIAHIDDDDRYAPGTRALMQDAIEKTPLRPVLFRMRYPNGITLWRDPALYCGNVGTPMMLIPNAQNMMGRWGSFVGGDCAFLETMRWYRDEIVWRPEVIALLGHNT
jgi:hypothetical protein